MVNGHTVRDYRPTRNITRSETGIYSPQVYTAVHVSTYLGALRVRTKDGIQYI